MNAKFTIAQLAIKVYGIKQVAPVVVEEHYGLVVVTVYVFYF